MKYNTKKTKQGPPMIHCKSFAFSFLLSVSEYTCYTWIQCTGGTDWGLYWVLDELHCLRMCLTKITPLVLCWTLFSTQPKRVCLTQYFVYFLSVIGTKFRWESESAFYSFCECRRKVIWTGWVRHCWSMFKHVENIWYYLPHSWW